ncbi:MAG: lactonase family protein [Oscillospiraceae bacterium]
MFDFYVGTCDTQRTKGIYRFEVEPEREIVSIPKISSELHFASYIVRSVKEFIYAVSEPKDSTTGEIVAYRRGTMGTLLEIDRITTEFGTLCHLAINKAATVLVAVSYDGGAIGMITLAKNGSFKAITDVVKYEGHGILPEQEQSHPHCACFSPDQTRVIISDLGCDSLYGYRIDYNKDKFIPRNELTFNFPDGSGPRHLLFSPDGLTLYVLCELSDTIYVLRHRRYAQSTIIGVTKLPVEPLTTSGAAAIKFDPTGKYLYVTSRRDNTIMYFEILPSGTLNFMDKYDCGGINPRDIAIEPSTDILICANVDSNRLTFFKRDPNSGALNKMQTERTIGKPQCLLVLD